MSTTVWLPTMTFAAAAMACRPAEPGASGFPDADRAAIERVADSQQVLFNAGKFDEDVALTFAEDAVSLPPNSPAVVGRPAIQAYMKTFPPFRDFSMTAQMIDGRGSIPRSGRSSRHDRRVAVKVLDERLSAALGPERFLREITTAARLQHPHIVPVFDSGEGAGRLFYVMPLIEGESLRDRLTRERRLDSAEAVKLAREVADALDYAHGQGVIHRDIKPENILLSRGQGRRLGKTARPPRSRIGGWA